MGDQNKTKDRVNMAKQLSFSNESREALEKGVNFVANAVKVIPLGKLGSCSQIANLVSFLVSSNAGSYITGQTISIDGGMSI